MSFMLTSYQIKWKTKTVTRRRGWKFLKAGDILNACVKCQGIPKGGKIEKICEIRVVSVKRERLSKINKKELGLEGFPDWPRQDFINMFCDQIGGHPEQTITRIEFEYV